MKPVLLKECRQCKQSEAIAYVEGVRHGVYVRDSTNQSAAMAYVTGCTYAVLTNQSAAIAYATGYTYAVLTNQSAPMAYVTLRTSRDVRTLFDQSGHDILMRVRPLNKYAQPRTAAISMHSLAQPQ